jgi:hypothetical protein
MAPPLLKSLLSSSEEETTMNARTNEATINGYIRHDQNISEGTHFAQYAMLNELPGLVFGFLTLAWIVTSLVNLI